MFVKIVFTSMSDDAINSKAAKNLILSLSPNKTGILFIVKLYRYME